MSELERMLADNGVASLVFLDLDDFKTVNDSLGHSAGDQLLASAAQHLRASLRPGDLVARLGGDEFAILTAGEEDVEMIAWRALEAVNRSHGLYGHDVRPTASAGIATGTEADSILRNADLAMYAAKNAGGGTVSAFAPGMLAEAKERLVLAGELRRAELLDELVLHYQPTFDLRTGRIESVEALIRWQHPTRGLLQPGEFIGHAESTGAINRIGRWALETATAQLAQWQAELGQPPRVAVNISTIQLRSPDLLAGITAQLLKSNLPPEALRLELTESAVLRSDDNSKAVLRALAQLGVQLALDDFGKGYSSVGYLSDLPFSILKIDKSFLDDPQHADSPLLRGIIGLAKAMELIVVAEGIERQDQLVDRAQAPLRDRPGLLPRPSRAGRSDHRAPERRPPPAPLHAAPPRGLAPPAGHVPGSHGPVPGTRFYVPSHAARVGAPNGHGRCLAPICAPEATPVGSWPFGSRERWVSAGDRRGVDQRCGGLAVDQEAVEEVAQLVDRAQVHLDVEAVFAGDPVALGDLRDLGGELGDPRQLAGGRLHADDRLELVAECARVDLGSVARDHAVALEPLDALGDRRRREADPPAQLGERDAPVRRELADDSTVGLVDLRSHMTLAFAGCRCFQRRSSRNAFDSPEHLGRAGRDNSGCLGTSQRNAHDGTEPRRRRAAAGVLRRERRLPLPRPVVRRAALRTRRRPRCRLAAHRLGGARVRDLAPALAHVHRPGSRRSAG